MSDFLPLSPVLAYRYHLNFDELPANLRERIESAFVIPWNRLTPERRRRYAELWDCEHDPAIEHERKAVAELFDEMEAVSANIDKWESIGTPTARDLSIQEDRLRPLYKTRDELEATKRRMRGDCYGDHIEPKEPPCKTRKTERDLDCSVPSEAEMHHENCQHVGRRERQLKVLVDEIKRQKWETSSIPRGGKKELRPCRHRL